MKLKSYMRGLGIGIVVTALIMGIATKDGRPMTDAEIKAAAAKLGMVESNSLKLTDLNQDGAKPEESTEPEAESKGGTEPEGGAESEDGTEAEDGTESEDGAEPEDGAEAENGTEPEEAEPGPTASPGTAAEPEQSAESTPESDAAPPRASAETPDSAESQEADILKITVKSGTGSRSVCNQLAEAGLIEDAAAFDQYLIDSGYSKRISAGTFEIPVGASEEEIAKIISKSR